MKHAKNGWAMRDRMTFGSRILIMRGATTITKVSGILANSDCKANIPNIPIVVGNHGCIHGVVSKQNEAVKTTSDTVTPTSVVPSTHNGR